MTVHYTITGNLFRLHMEGNYTPEDIIETYNAALKDPRLPKDARFIFDVSKSEEMATRETAVIKSIARYFAEHSDIVGRRCAILAVKPVHFGLSRMAATVAELRGAEVRVFNNEADAISWLNSDVETETD